MVLGLVEPLSSSATLVYMELPLVQHCSCPLHCPPEQGEHSLLREWPRPLPVSQDSHQPNARLSLIFESYSFFLLSMEQVLNGCVCLHVCLGSTQMCACMCVCAAHGCLMSAEVTRKLQSQVVGTESEDLRSSW